MYWILVDRELAEAQSAARAPRWQGLELWLNGFGENLQLFVGHIVQFKKHSIRSLPAPCAFLGYHGNTLSRFALNSVRNLASSPDIALACTFQEHLCNELGVRSLRRIIGTRGLQHVRQNIG